MSQPSPVDWSSAINKIQRLSDRNVLRLLRETQRDVERMLADLAKRKQGIGNLARQSQLQLVKRNLQREQAELWRKLGDVVKARRLEAAARVIELGELSDSSLLRVLGKSLGDDIAKSIADAEVDAAKSGLDRMITRVNGDSYVALSQRVYNSSVHINGQLNRMVNSALARGLSAVEFAREVRDFVNPNTPGGVRYAAMRLARTEINNAAHAIAINQVQDKPWVEKMKWHLSGSHPKPDICDQLASGGPKNDGLYPKTEVPAKPHPHCFCFVTPVVPSDDEFLDALLGGEYNDYLERYSPGISDRFRAHGGSFIAPSTPKIPAAPKTPPKRAPKPKAPVPPQPPEPPKPAPQPRPPVVQKPATVPTPAPPSVPHIQGVDLPEDIKRNVMAEMARQARIVPKGFFDTLRGISIPDEEELKRFNMGDSTNAYYLSGQRQMRLRPHIFTEESARAGDRSMDSGWWSQGRRFREGAEPGTPTTAHEFGHHIDFMMRDQAQDVLGGFKALNQFWKDMADHLGIRQPANSSIGILELWVKENKAKIVERVSQYGSTSPYELMAEIWREFSMNPNARPHIKAIGNDLLKLMKFLEP